MNDIKQTSVAISSIRPVERLFDDAIPVFTDFPQGVVDQRVAVSGRPTLVVIQPTTYCNLDCSYCYLPDRARRRELTVETAAAIGQQLAAARWLLGGVDILWHGGEPLTVSVERFAALHEALTRPLSGRRVRNLVQTNATLITRRWARFLSAENFSVGVSVDGPDWLHDRHRRTRQGNGTAELARRGIARLNEHGLHPSLLAVLTLDSLRYAKEVMDSVAQLGVYYVGFNPEEVEGANGESSLDRPGARHHAYAFYREVLQWLVANRQAGVVVREVELVCRMLRSEAEAPVNASNTALRILTFDHRGSYSSFSPELLAYRADGGFLLGNVVTDRLDHLPRDRRLRHLSSEVRLGVERCRQHCRYFRFCGGGSPSNKLAENGTFMSSETLACRLRVQAAVDAVMDHLRISPQDIECFVRDDLSVPGPSIS